MKLSSDHHHFLHPAVGFVLAAAAMQLLSGCAGDKKTKSASNHADRSRAAVDRNHASTEGEPDVGPRELHINDYTITVEDILDPVLPTLAESARTRPPDQLGKLVFDRTSAELVNQVQDALLFQEASKAITEEMQAAVDRVVDQELKDRVNKEFGGRQARFEAHLASMSMTLDDAREKTRRRLLIIKHLQDHVLPRIAAPTRRELMDYYEANITQYTQPEVRELFMIEIPKGQDEPAARAAIVQAYQQVQQGRSFEEVAREYSKGLHVEEGGRWGTIKSPLQGRYARPSEVFYQLAPQQFSDIIETQDAFFMVKAGEVQPARTTPFADVQIDLTERYRGVQFEQLRARMLQGLLEKAVIEPDEDLFLKQVVAEAMQRLGDGSSMPGLSGP